MARGKAIYVIELPAIYIAVDQSIQAQLYSDTKITTCVTYDIVI